MTEILTPLVVEELQGNYVRLQQPFIFKSKVLADAGLQSTVVGPAGFVFDFESVPLIRGSNKRGGTAHDILCRLDSMPIVSKIIAAKVYLEIMLYAYKHDEQTLEEKEIKRKIVHAWNIFRAYFKFTVVLVAWGYFHKLKMDATLEEIRGIKKQ